MHVLLKSILIINYKWWFSWGSESLSFATFFDFHWNILKIILSLLWMWAFTEHTNDSWFSTSWFYWSIFYFWSTLFWTWSNFVASISDSGLHVHVFAPLPTCHIFSMRFSTSLCHRHSDQAILPSQFCNFRSREMVSLESNFKLFWLFFQIAMLLSCQLGIIQLIWLLKSSKVSSRLSGSMKLSAVAINVCLQALILMKRWGHILYCGNH